MKRVFSFVLFLIGSVTVALSQVGIGMRDTRYFNIHYSFKGSYYAEIEQSAFSSPLGMQKTRLYLGYFHQFQKIEMKVRPYGSLFWNGDFDYGAKIKCSYPFQRLKLYGIINPHYDNILKSTLRYEAGARLRVLANGGLSACYTTITPYRTPEKLIECGIWLESGKLGVSPVLAIPIETPEKYLRVMCNFHYNF